MLSRLPITLAQLKVGNNSEKLINEITQLLYSLYRSKKLTKTIYNHLINTKTLNQLITTNLKFLLQLGMILLTCLSVLILLQIFKIILNLSLKNMKLLTENSPIEIHPNKIKNRIVFKIKAGYK